MTDNKIDTLTNYFHFARNINDRHNKIDTLTNYFHFARNRNDGLVGNIPPTPEILGSKQIKE